MRPKESKEKGRFNAKAMLYYVANTRLGQIVGINVTEGIKHSIKR